MAHDGSPAELRVAGKRDFWSRQFVGEFTAAQKLFDWGFGIALPLLCFALDPGIIKGGPPGLLSVDLSSYKAFIYLLSALAMLTLALWLLLGHRIKLWSGSVGGIFFAGAACSLTIGLLILPLTVLGMMFIIGFLGLAPFFAAFVYLRNGVRAVRQGAVYSGRALLAASTLLSAAFMIAAPAVAQHKIYSTTTQSMREILGGDAQASEAAARRLKYLRWFADLDQLVTAYASETEPLRRARLATAYKEITGEDIETRLAILQD